MKTFLDTWSTRLYEKCSPWSKAMQMIYFQGMSTSNYLHIFTAMQRFEMKIWNQNHAFSEALCWAGKCFLHSASGGQKCLQRAEDRRCLLIPRGGMAVLESGLLDWAHGAERGWARCWHKLFFHVQWLLFTLPLGLHHFCCGYALSLTCPASPRGNVHECDPVLTLQCISLSLSPRYHQLFQLWHTTRSQLGTVLHLRVAR